MGGRDAAATDLTLISIERVSMRFGAVTALDDVSLEVARGEVVSLLGASGSGKSTLLKLVAGIERPTAGRIAIDGVEVAGPRTFVDPENRTRVGVLMDVPNMETLTAAMDAPGAAEAMEYDGVLPETLVILVES